MKTCCLRVAGLIALTALTCACGPTLATPGHAPVLPGAADRGEVRDHRWEAAVATFLGLVTGWGGRVGGGHVPVPSCFGAALPGCIVAAGAQRPQAAPGRRACQEHGAPGSAGRSEQVGHHVAGSGGGANFQVRPLAGQLDAEAGEWTAFLLGGRQCGDLGGTAGREGLALGELCIDLPDADCARWHLARRTAGDIVAGRTGPARGATELWLGYLKIRDNGSGLTRWNAYFEAVLSGWPAAGGFESEHDTEQFAAAGRQLVSQLQDELGASYQVEHRPEPIRPPGVKLRRRPNLLASSRPLIGMT